jgi:cyclase
MFYGASSEIFALAKEHRENMTSAEILLWEELKSNKLRGERFKSQHPISTFIADFYCHKAKLIIEVDGKVHDKPENRKYDRQREQVLQEYGLKVLRFRNEEIIDNIEDVLQRIASALQERLG